MESSGSGSGLDLDLLSASLRADAGDLAAFVESVATKLEEALPGRVQVYRWRERMFGPKVVRKVRFDAGDRRLELTYHGGVLDTSCSRLSGGIVLKNEPLDLDAWLAAMVEALEEEARRSAATRQALERLLIR